jgi:hypothetical protein
MAAARGRSPSACAMGDQVAKRYWSGSLTLKSEQLVFVRSEVLLIVLGHLRCKFARFELCAHLL